MAWTIKELYEYALKTDRTDYRIKLQHQDEGGVYDGSSQIQGVDFDDDDEKTATLW